MKDKYKYFRPQIRSRHPSHRPLRRELGLLPFRSIVRFGSITTLLDTITNGGKRIELNTVNGVKNTSNKEIMKKLFIKNGIVTPIFYTLYSIQDYKFTNHLKDKEKIVSCKDIRYPIVAKRTFHSRGRDLHKIDSFEDLKNFLNNHPSGFHFEQFYSGITEYRLHVSPHLTDPIFSIRKLRYQNEDGSFGWIFNSKEGYFIEDFDKPKCWKAIIKESKKAVKSLEMDMGTLDVKCNRSGTEFTIIEINSAPGMGPKTIEAFKKAIIEILTIKHKICADF